jgi:hypothetical protein
VRCCETGAVSVTGYWQPVQSIEADVTTISLTINVDKSSYESYTETDTWSQSITNAASVGFKVKGATASDTVTLSESFSSTLTEQYSETWSVSTTSTYTVQWGSGATSQYLWQWVNIVEDNSGNTLNCQSKDYGLTPNKATPPKCLPGYNAAGVTDYQSCTSDGYLPGYSASGARNLAEEQSHRSRYLRAAATPSNVLASTSVSTASTSS